MSLADRTFSSSFSTWNEKTFTLQKDVKVTFGCLCVAPSIGLLLKQHDDMQRIPERTSVKEALDSSAHDDELCTVSAAIQQFGAMIPGCKCEADGALTTLASTLHELCQSRRVSRGRTARQPRKGLQMTGPWGIGALQQTRCNGWAAAKLQPCTILLILTYNKCHV